jgi:hypothetical protein
MRRSVDRADSVPHSLIPLALAVGVVRYKAYGGGQPKSQGPEGELNMLAAFIAATVPVYEFQADRPAAVRALSKPELEGGLFRDSGRELRFLDGRPAKRNLAVNATDVACVVSLLKDPDDAARIRSRFARRRAQEIKAQSKELIGQATELRRESQHLRSACATTAHGVVLPTAG